MNKVAAIRKMPITNGGAIQAYPSAKSVTPALNRESDSAHQRNVPPMKPELPTTQSSVSSHPGLRYMGVGVELDVLGAATSRPFFS